jgi:hypothetical protein
MVRHREGVRRHAAAGCRARLSFVTPARTGIQLLSSFRDASVGQRKLDPGLRPDDGVERALRRRIPLRPRCDRRRGYGATRNKFLKSATASG